MVMTLEPPKYIFDPANLTPNDYKSGVPPVWCPGCGDYGVLASFLKAISELRIPREQLAIVSGIGCSSRFPAFVEAYGFHGTHGRALPIAAGIKMARPDLIVVTMGGDGDAFSIGMGHIPHAIRRNMDITYIVMDNEIYGLTKGQPSPTSPIGILQKASPYGTVERPLNPLQLALGCGATWVARGFSSKPKELGELIKAAIQHKGFSLLQVLSPCVTFYDTYDHFKSITKFLPAEHNPRDRTSALKYALDEQTLYMGVFYQEESEAFDAGYAAMRARVTTPNYGVREIMNKYMR
ncbi:MAG: 2-oxoacid:ferredoxin oxidoreductase subunit beta [Chloroflexi bacterium]|nr:2-oxoacid:ferredoxin oxidoreductase subunit beta [Chloroflexota bacterium]